MEERPVIVGAVATHPDSLVHWEGVRACFLGQRTLMDYTLYSNFDRLTDQLLAGQVDVARLSPLAFVRARRRIGGLLAPLVVGDRDRDTRSHLVVREGAAPFAPTDLEGATLAIAGSDNAAARILPLYFLRQAGVQLPRVEMLPHELDPGKGGESLVSERAVLAAVREGRAVAGVVGDRAWRSARASGELAGLVEVWASPVYDGALYCSLASVPTVLRTDFERVMRAMSPGVPEQAVVLELAGVGGWVSARESGYVALRHAIDERAAW